MKRTTFVNNALPNYSKGEEIMNMVTHIVGAALGILALILCICKTNVKGALLDTVSVWIYGISLVTLYTISSIYHGLRVGTGKKVLQILDHCTIYFLIVGTYTPILVSAILPKFLTVFWFLLILQYGLGVLATTLTAIDMRKYKAFSMICYILMGWSLIFFAPQAYIALGHYGFSLILWGGIAYSVGAVLFGIGAKLHWFHSVFHIFVLIGSILQFLGIYLFIL